MKDQLISLLMSMLFAVLTPENLKKFIDAGLDAIEDIVADSSNTMDDKIVLPICKLVRNAFDVPDNDMPDRDLL
jgi:hypothetical protein